MSRGNCCYFLKDYEKAISDYTEVIGFEPSNALAYSNRGSAYSAMGDLKSAESDFIKAKDLDPGMVEAYYNLACIYSRRKEIEKACENLSIAIMKGYRDWNHIGNDPDLNNIRDSECYQRVMKEKGK